MFLTVWESTGNFLLIPEVIKIVKMIRSESKIQPAWVFLRIDYKHSNTLRKKIIIVHLSWLIKSLMQNSTVQAAIIKNNDSSLSLKCYWERNTQFSSVQSLSRVQLFATPWIAAHQASLSISNSRSSLRPTSIGSVIPSSHLIFCLPLLLLPPIPPSIRVFSNESILCLRWPKYWSFSFSISPYNEYSGLISFRMDWLDLLAVQGTLKRLLQHHSSKASNFQLSLSL